MRFVALGDSITLGMGDPLPGGAWRGWAALLAESLPSPDGFHNLAQSGAMIGDVWRGQVPAAIALRPDVVSIIVGVNDTLRRRFDGDVLREQLGASVRTLVATGAVVLTIRLPDPGLMFGLPGALARPLARRVRAINAAMDDIAARHDTLHFDAAGHEGVYDRRMWSVDRLHPSERGHRLLAGAYHDLMRGAGLALGPRPGPEPRNPAPTRAAQLRWLATKGTGWLVARSTDLVPALTWLAAVETARTLATRALRTTPPT
ncbi:SGNH/GDSL hydrolase family protein [Luedemannella flava]|uniref:SGNH/GDSL hydrolase family protein n=1 Tax=Luedemannella flava TaxID=349316 RepID=A0ABN2MBE8_9ACTN